MAQLVRRSRPVLAVVPDAENADALIRDLRFLLGPDAVLRQLPVEEQSPYSSTSPSLEVVGERLATLLALSCGDVPDAIVATGAGLLRRSLELGRLTAASRVLTPGDEVGREALIEALLRCGYSRAPLVEDPATFAVRGSLVDVYVPGDPWPVRVDLFGDTIESLRAFDPATQRTGQQLASYAFGPVREFLFDPVTTTHARDQLLTAADAVDFPTRKLRAMLADLDNGIPFFGIEALAPAFSPALRPSLWALLQQALGAAPTVALVEPAAIRAAAEQAWQELGAGHAEARARQRLSFEPAAHAVPVDDVLPELERLATLSIEPLVLDHAAGERVDMRSAPASDLTREIERIAKNASAGDEPPDLFRPVKTRLESLRRDGVATLVAVRGSAGVERMRALLTDHQLGVRVLAEMPDLLAPDVGASIYQRAVHAHLVATSTLPAAGAIMPAARLAVLTEEDIFGRRAARRTSDTRAPFRTTLADLNDGDVVVHVDFGIGVYRGLTRLNVRGVDGDYLLVTYRDDDKLYLPVTRINLVQRYAGDEDHRPRLDKLGGQTWAKTKRRVKDAILAMAQELLALYARREVAVGQACISPDAMFREFEGRFAFEETPDQARAIEQVVADLQKPRPMDRLVCGDVGYGKTEVAMRAAMLAVLSGHQVAVLAPTTVLAQQHFWTFGERFKGFPVRIEVISRLRSSGEVTHTLERARGGQIDILIGTHRLLSHDVNFKNLGLLVVDEEHRFGVKDKERIKALRANVDVLSLSATPIPRTLQMGFFGIRDLSVIDTPPADRRAIRTVVTRFDEQVVREAIERELARGGQVYFVHNRVMSIGGLADFVRRLVPAARVGVAHGQLPEQALEKVMLAFMRGDTNVLVTTTIIESGIDIPRANTIVINRADMLGLAQLYQLRGRVGRSFERAYAYLLVPPETRQMTPQAHKRLEVLQRFVELGAGFKIAQHDLEIRGAGDLLGKAQHGHVAAVGYEMYAELLAQAVGELQGRAVEVAPEPELNVHVAAYIPDSYVADIHERLAFYQKMATAATTNDVVDIVSALEDRYGEAPVEVRTLGEVMALKVMLKGLSARAIDLVAPRDGVEEPARVVIALGDSTRLDPERIAHWVAEQPARVKLTPQMKLYLTAAQADWLAAGADMVELARRFLNEVRTRAGAAPAAGSSVDEKRGS